MREQEKLYDFGGYPEISAYSVGAVQFYGTDLRIVLFDWYLNDGVWQRRIVGTVKRPVSTASPEWLAKYRDVADAGPKELSKIALH